MFNDFKIVRLTDNTVIDDFDCGNFDLNSFLKNDALNYQRRLLAVTYLLKKGNDIVAYFSLSNDKLLYDESDKATWRKIKSKFPHRKHRLDYPAVKIGRLAVAKNCQCLNVGTTVLNLIQDMFVSNNRTGCAFITVDALNTAVPFYQKNGFLPLDRQSFLSNPETNLVYYDLSQLV